MATPSKSLLRSPAAPWRQPWAGLRPELVAIFAGLFAVGLLLSLVFARAHVAAELDPEHAAKLIGSSAVFQRPLFLDLPPSDVVQRGSREAATYAALESQGLIEARLKRTLWYRGYPTPSQEFDFFLTTRGRTLATEQKWPLDDRVHWHMPLATRRLVRAQEMLESKSSSGAAIYWFEWQWTPTSLGGELDAMLPPKARIPQQTYRGRAQFQRDGSRWSLTEVRTEAWTK